MTAAGWVAGLLLGAVFVVAGASKLVLGRRWIDQARGLGVPAWLAAGVPWWELAVGAVLAVHLAPLAAGVAALATLGAFTVLLVAHLRRGDRPPCACFGAWSSAPIRWADVVRNGVLIVLGAVVVSVR